MALDPNLFSRLRVSMRDFMRAGQKQSLPLRENKEEEIVEL
jgi:hypothetical protein